MKPVAIIKTGNTFSDIKNNHGDFETWIANGLGSATPAIEIIDVTLHHPLPQPDSLAGAVITGSHDNVTDNPHYCAELESWIRRMVAAQTPLLGICFGHQIIAKALGGVVDFHPVSLEVGTKEIQLLETGQKDMLFRGMPDRFKAHVFHSQSIRELPGKAVILVKNSFEPYQAVRFAPRTWGVQFHPEADDAIAKCYLFHLADDIRKSGQSLNQLSAQLEKTPYAAAILERFGHILSTMV
ncbi:glutamine amidotransferase [Desulfobacter hydrogenophilus]|uniref:Glutamine amidotransferase n=1 Tax=Desulfobacter hydrogenophilus TaxID=2291 RepID=A0A328F6N2_9BACT|nr:glutamine amidotransferase [Desulfobacter hydrogenophilus]NDY72087.1 glutamine amidotransferase [Desulfobacter hydrogenophilus]QBH14813.1 glutamine amidotransferase [Desulfobacter hydrogenophilus]RAM00029.1 glutamine amidotransferase [Desulfobacter hydrogenophilus]